MRLIKNASKTLRTIEPGRLAAVRGGLADPRVADGRDAKTVAGQDSTKSGTTTVSAGTAI